MTARIQAGVLGPHLESVRVKKYAMNIVCVPYTFALNETIDV